MSRKKSTPVKSTRTATAAVWMNENWRSVAFIVYCAICLFDFIIMPGIYEATNKTIDPAAAAAIAKQFTDPAVQQEILQKLLTKREWVPLTMAGAAAFHFAFGAILTGAAWTRGMVQVEQAKRARPQIPPSSVTPDNPDNK